MRPLFCGLRINPIVCLILTLTIVLAAQAGSRGAQKKVVNNDSGGSLVILSDTATISIDDESFSIPGTVNIELPDTKIAGRDFTYNNKTGLGALHGDPITVSYSRGGKSTLTASDLSFDSKNQTARMSGGVSAAHSTGTISVGFHAGSVDLDLYLSVFEATGKVTLSVADSATGQNNQASSTVETKNKSALSFATSPAVFTADYIRYNMKTGDVLTGDNPRVELPDAVLSSRGPVKASTTDKTVEAGNGIDLLAGVDTSAHADRVTINYGDETAFLSGNVTGTRGNDSFSAGAVRIEYPKTGSVIYFSGGVDIKVSTGKNTREKVVPGQHPGACPANGGVYKTQKRNCETLEP